MLLCSACNLLPATDCPIAVSDQDTARTQHASTAAGGMGLSHANSASAKIEASEICHLLIERAVDTDNLLKLAIL